MLAADAAHLCNPFGGLGLTGGLVDVGNLAECLVGMENGWADDSILTKYDEIRRQKYQEVINPISSDNFLRVSATDPSEALVKDQFLMMVEKARTDKSTREELDQGVFAVCHDFTQYYNKAGKEAVASARL
jgi:2-polyprenyl-6-methoxyphenol hydroxylase-like FAD-dependent oxidoreductase